MTIKVQDVISKVTVHSNSDTELVKRILSWVKDSKPIVVVNNKPWRYNK